MSTVMISLGIWFLASIVTAMMVGPCIGYGEGARPGGREHHAR